MAQRRIGPLIAGQNGTYTAVMEDGSTVVYDGQLNQIGGDPNPNPTRAALMQSGDTEAAAQTIQRSSEEDARRFDQNYKQRSDEINNTYKVNMLSARTNADQARAQTQLARDRLALDRETQQQEFGLKQANLGYNVLNIASQLRGPQNYFQASNFARGVNAQPGTSVFLNALQNNTRLAGFGAQAGSPTAVSLGNLLGGNGVSSGGQAASGGAGTSADDQLVNQIHAIGAAGAQKLGNGALEQLSPTEYQAFLSGLEAPDQQGKAFDANTFLDQYRRSRIGQGLGSAAAA